VRTDVTQRSVPSVIPDDITVKKTWYFQRICDRKMIEQAKHSDVTDSVILFDNYTSQIVKSLFITLTETVTEYANYSYRMIPAGNIVHLLNDWPWMKL
jgi:hypothetical protein